MTAPDKNIRVLVVDDSALMRKMVGDIISGTPGLELAGTASDGLECLAQVKKLKPDVVTLDIEMPVMDGLKALARLMSETPVAVLILSAHAVEGAEATLLALELGAVDFVTKPSGSISLDIEKVRQQLVEKVFMAAGVDLEKLKSRRPPRKTEPAASPSHPQPHSQKIIVIGSSTGGTRALAEIIPKLPGNLNAGLILIQHMPVGFTKSLAERLSSRSRIMVQEAREGDVVKPGLALLAPADYHLTVDASGQNILLNQDPPRFGVRPSVDVTMESLAANARVPLVGVILTGMGHDGAKGMAAVKRQGGHTIAEDRSTCVVFGMPKSAIETGMVDLVLPLPQIPQAIVSACS
ncbi:MAG: chemotaxis response regulator protein-glutamate methylesterase [Deltaproteobacteria bacterium]|nr:chemotaxis response regulator protein-glutamate methylesterase [Deltaproteobacteria bacterium]